MRKRAAAGRIRIAVVLVMAIGVGCSGGSTRHGAAPSTTMRLGTAETATSSATGQRSSASVRASCPRTAPLTVPHHQRDGTTRTLVPGQPVALLACRYHGFNQPQRIGSFARAAELPASPFALGLNASQRPPLGIASGCPSDSGEWYMLSFSYRDGRPLLVRVSHGGCRFVTNGDLTLEFPQAEVTQVLEATLGSDVVRR